jgi:hypothetical protein
VGAADRTRSGAERRDRTTTVALQTSAPNESSGAECSRNPEEHLVVFGSPRTDSVAAQSKASGRLKGGAMILEWKQLPPSLRGVGMSGGLIGLVSA